MVFESLVNPLTAERKPYEMFFIGAVYTGIAVIISLLLFGEYASLVTIFLIVLLCSTIMYRTIQLEEQKDLTFDNERKLLREHSRALAVFTFLFLGIAVSVSVIYIFLPADTASALFSTQETTIMSITGNMTNPGGMFWHIFLSNLRLLLISMVFAFIFGFGAIFILAWNASVMGVVIGSFTRNAVGGSYFGSYSLGILRYMTHGIPEIIAYFAAGLGAGIISVAIIRHDFHSRKFRNILFDSTELIVFSVAMLFAAALIEVYVTPMFF